MNTTLKSDHAPSHKILLVLDDQVEIIDNLFTSLYKEGLTSTQIVIEDLNASIDAIKGDFLWIHTSLLDDETLLTVMNRIPELTGVFFCFKKGESRLDMLRSIALARRHYIAIIGALFLVESKDDENIGVDICRRSGIPYLYSAIQDGQTKKSHIGQNTIDSLVQMAR